MLTTVQGFCERARHDLGVLVDELSIHTGRDTPEERRAWENSLRPLGFVLSAAQRGNPDLANAHILLGGLALEYRLPSSSSWCDVVLLGADGTGRPRTLIVELKHWDTSGDTAASSEGLVQRQGMLYGHPSDQVRGYTLYCRHFHSEVNATRALVDGCVFFTRNTPVTVYRSTPYETLVREYPVFSYRAGEHGSVEFGRHVLNIIRQPSDEFARRFVRGRYVQKREILSQVATALRDSEARPFVLLDRQREGFFRALDVMDRATTKGRKKQVIIITGPPGTGKSAIAVNLWIEAARKYAVRGNVVFVTTSSSQKTNWVETFTRSGRSKTAGYFVLPANNFNPGLTVTIVKRLRSRGHPMKVLDWMENLRVFEEHGGEAADPPASHFAAIVDEAHALFHPRGHRSGFAGGWTLHAGPQAYHIMWSSTVSVFLLDEKQSYRDNETTRLEELEELATMVGADCHRLDLSGSQFRCAGSKEYVDWIDGVLGVGDSKPARSWRLAREGAGESFRFEILDSPAAMEDKLRERMREGKTARILSSYSVPWKTKRCTDSRRLHKLRAGDQDFCITLGKGRNKQVWSRPWNFVPSGDYSSFIQAPEGTAMNEDPLSEVGCPYVVRGFDFDYLGILWLEDLVWRQGRWVLQLDHVHETALRTTLGRARQGQQVALLELEERIKLGYRILFTRGIEGAYLYVYDKPTRAHIEELLTQ